MLSLSLLIQLPILLFSVIVHEVAHGWTAERFGDDTARVMGRLTFNPIPHIDPIGTLLLPAIALLTHAPLFGWARPVPVNPYRLNDPRRDMVWVSLAGPLSNISLALLGAAGMFLLRTFGASTPLAVSAYELLRFVVVINIILPIFNLIPIPPLDGSKVVMGILPSSLAYQYSQIEPYGFFIVIILFTSGVISSILWPIVSVVVYYLGAALPLPL